MRFLAVSSPHGFTTRDVWQRVMTGLRANGQEVYPYDLLPRWRIFDVLLTLAAKAKAPMPDGFYANLLAYEPVFGAAHFHEVDAVVIVSPQYCPLPLVDILRKSGKMTIAYFTECPYEDTLVAPQQAAHFDYVFVNDRNSVGLYESFAERVFYMPHCYDPDVHYPPVAKPEGVDSKVIFIGTGYPSRREFFREIDWKGIDLELYGLWWLPSRSKLRRHLRGEVVENEDAANIYRSSAIGLSLHRNQRYVDVGGTIDDGEAYSAGPRTWELAACGTFQVSDYRQEIEDVFGDAVPFYGSPKELERIVRQALEEPAWREQKAQEQHAAVEAGGYDCASTMKRLLEAVA